MIIHIKGLFGTDYENYFLSFDRKVGPLVSEDVKNDGEITIRKLIF